VRGYIAALAEGSIPASHGAPAGFAPGGPTRGPQNVFVNRRIVKDRTIAHAIIDAYSVASIKERSPEVHLFIDMPREAVDVNVHPTKAEVRFRDQSYIHQVIRRAIADTIGRGRIPELTLQSPAAGERQPSTIPLPSSFASVIPSRWTHPDATGPPVAGAFNHFRPGELDTAVVGSGSPGLSRVEGSQTAGLPPRDRSLDGVEGNRAEGGDSNDRRADSAGTTDIRPMIPLGQFRDTFIIAVDDEGIAIIDQHVAHERVLFERITERLATGRLESQRLLEPVLVELSAGGREALSAHAADLDRLGFEVEAFGGNAVRVSAFPALLRRDECEVALRALANDFDGLDSGAAVGEAIRRIAATMACHAAVKANDPLTHDKMAHILEELRRTAYSTICPHGRPVMLRLTRREVEKNFQRI
jgi:DNA mismatch repair protein MutL